MTTEEFVEKAKEAHGDKYDYSPTRYVDRKTKIEYVCPIHGLVRQIPYVHLIGCGCAECGRISMKRKESLTTEEFVEKARKAHGDKYDYGMTRYVNAKTKVEYACPIHGLVKQSPFHHLNGCGCPECGRISTRNKRLLTTEKFIEISKKVHGDKYDYSLTKYVNAKTKVNIICHEKDENGVEHGVYQMIPPNHMRGDGCKKCAMRRRAKNHSISFDKFKEKANGIFGEGRYEYVEESYTGYREPMTIICHRKDKYGNEHGPFRMKPYKHTCSAQGCKKCSTSNAEIEAMQRLRESGVPFEWQKRFGWLGLYSLDLYVPSANAAIECQGEQHFMPIAHFGGEENFKATAERDRRKLEACREHGVRILYYSKAFGGDKFLGEPLYHSLDDVLEEIREAASATS